MVPFSKYIASQTFDLSSNVDYMGKFCGKLSPPAQAMFSAYASVHMHKYVLCNLLVICVTQVTEVTVITLYHIILHLCIQYCNKTLVHLNLICVEDFGDQPTSCCFCDEYTPFAL